MEIKERLNLRTWRGKKFKVTFFALSIENNIQFAIIEGTINMERGNSNLINGSNLDHAYKGRFV